MRKKFEKLILLDFLKLLEKKEGIKPSEKFQYLLEEIISRIIKLIIKTLLSHKLIDSVRKLTKISKNQGFEEILCNLCRSEAYEIVWDKKGFRSVRCLNCGLVFVTPRFSREGRKYFYSSKYNFMGYPLFNLFNKLDLVINEHLVSDQVLEIITLYKNSGDLIEIGLFGKELIKRAESIGFKCWRMRSKCWVYESPVEGREYETGDGCFSINGRKFDVVSCLDILDQIPDPLEELNGLYRILKDNGILVIRVPNYSSRIAEEKGRVWGYNRPWEKIYQFDYLHLEKLLDKSRFKVIDLKTELSEGVGYVGGIIVVGMKKTRRIRKKNPRILMIREGAAGDVLLTTPIIKELKMRYPNSNLKFRTKYPEILQNNPYVDEVIRFVPKDGVDVVFNLIYELYPEIPIVEAYAKITNLSIKYPEIELFISPEEQEEIHQFLKTLSIGDSKGLVVIHSLVGDRIKSWSIENYQAVSDYICSKQIIVATIGSPNDCVELQGAINLIGKLSLRQSAALISGAKLFIGLDSFPMHIANAFKIPSVVLFGSTNPNKVISYYCNVKIVQSSENCLGCRHDTAPDRWRQNVNCRRKRLYCMENISSDQVIEAIDHLVARGIQNDRKYPSHITR